MNRRISCTEGAFDEIHAPAPAGAAAAAIPNMPIAFNATTPQQTVSEVFSYPASFQLQELWDDLVFFFAEGPANVW